VSASDLVAMLRAAAADRMPSGRRGLWVTLLSAYGLEAVLGARRAAPDTSGAATTATGADAIDWIGSTSSTASSISATSCRCCASRSEPGWRSSHG